MPEPYLSSFIRFVARLLRGDYSQRTDGVTARVGTTRAKPAPMARVIPPEALQEAVLPAKLNSIGSHIWMHWKLSNGPKTGERRLSRS
jgi:hypothetical protein